MTDAFMRELRKRVDDAVQPHRDIYGDDSPVVKMAWRVLAEAEDIAAAMGAAKLSTAAAAEATDWSEDTLQARARAVLAGEPVPSEWAGLVVERQGTGYAFLLSSIPEKAKAAA